MDLFLFILILSIIFNVFVLFREVKKEYRYGIMTLIILLVCFYAALYIHAEKRGEINALSGNARYHLVKNWDGTITWREK